MALDYGTDFAKDKIRDYAGLKEGSGFLGDAGRFLGKAGIDGLVGLTGLGIAPSMDRHATHGEGFIDDLLGTNLGFGIKPKRKQGKKGKGVFADILKGIGHFGVDALATASGLGVNPLANPNEMIVKKKVAGSGRGLYL